MHSNKKKGNLKRIEKKKSHHSHLGLLEFFLAAEDESDVPSLAPPELVAPLGVISTNTQTERKRRNGRVGEGNYRKCDDFSLQKDKSPGDFLFKKCEKEKELAFR